MVLCTEISSIFPSTSANTSIVSSSIPTAPPSHSKSQTTLPQVKLVSSNPSHIKSLAPSTSAPIYKYFSTNNLHVLQRDNWYTNCNAIIPWMHGLFRRANQPLVSNYYVCC